MCLNCPRIGQQVRLHYNRKVVAAGIVPHHGKTGVVVARSTRGKPRNHLIRLDDGMLVIVNGGNLNRADAPSKIAISAPSAASRTSGLVGGEVAPASPLPASC